MTPEAFPESFGTQARPEHSGSSTIVSLTDMPSSTAPDAVSLHELVLYSLDEDQAQDVISIPLAGKSSIADYMVIASGRSTRQVASMATKLAERLKKQGRGSPRIEGLPAADWVLIDAGDVVVHLFRPEVRGFYNLERMWGFGEDAAPAAAGRA
jgi:ribosome-associated protein